jgi:hypothetical protein
MDYYSHALNVLNQMEQDWFRDLGLQFHVPPPVPPANTMTPPVPDMMNGEVQFFFIEYVRPNFSPKNGFFSFDQAFANAGEDPAALRLKPVPLFAAVGINYDQCLKPPGFPHNFPTHHLQRKSHCTTWVEDYSSSGMRAALNAALKHYVSNAPCWNANGYASSAIPPVFGVSGPVTDYILIATNVSPFNSQKAWLNYPHRLSTATLKPWNPNWHLCDLIKRLGPQIDLWIVLGKAAVWPTFIWPNPWTTNWLKTPNLSLQPLNSDKIATFWKHKQHTLKAPRPVWQWPDCPCKMTGVFANAEERFGRGAGLG